MPNTCAVLTCNQNYYKAKASGQHLSYFCFPTDPEIRELWVKSCKRGAPFNIKNSRICSIHFSKECYERDFRHELLNLKPKLRLIPGSVPTLFLGETTRWKKMSSKENEIRPKKEPVTEHELVGINDIDAANNEEVPRRKKSRLDSLGILRRSLRKKHDSNTKTDQDTIMNEIKAENTNTLDQQSEAEDLDTNLTEISNTTQNEETTENSDTAQNEETTEISNTTQTEETTENSNITQNKETTENSNTTQDKQISGNFSTTQNKQACENPNGKGTDGTLLKTYLLQTKDNTNNISFVLQNNQLKLPENPSKQQNETIKARDNTCVLRKDKEKNTRLKQLCLVIGTNAESNSTPHYVLREETLEEVVERQRGEIKNLMLERDELREKVVDQEKKLAYLMEKYEQSTKEKVVKAIIYSVNCKHK